MHFIEQQQKCLWLPTSAEIKKVEKSVERGVPQIKCCTDAQDLGTP